MRTREFGLLYTSLAANLAFIGLLWPYGRDEAASGMIVTGILLLLFGVVVVPGHMMVNSQSERDSRRLREQAREFLKSLENKKSEGKPE